MDSCSFLTTVSGIRMPRILYGTAWKQEATAGLVELALQNGFRGIDTAGQPRHYQEAGVGQGIATAISQGVLTREQLYLQSKFTPINGQDPERVPYDANASLSEQVRQSFASTQANLRCTYLDGLILHSPLAKREDLMEVWRAMEALVNAGLVGQIGISNCYQLETLEHLYCTATVKPAIVQNRFYAATAYDVEIRKFCTRHSIVYQSFWTLTANPGILNERTLYDLSIAYQRTRAQIFFRYLSQIGIVPLSGTTSVRHMCEDLAIFDFELTAGECEAIGRLVAVVEKSIKK